MAAVGDLVANLLLDTAQFARGVKRGKSGFSSLASAGKRAIGSIASAVSSGAVAAFEEQNRAVKLLENNLRATGGAAGYSSKQIQDFASQRQAMTNFGDEATIAGASVLATFKEIRGPIFLDALSTAQDMSAAFGTDLKGSMIQLGKALNDPMKGVSALAEVGVSFTEQQKQQIQAMQSVGDMAGAQKVILAELAGEVGGAAEATRSPLTGLTNAFGDLQEKFGELVAGGEGGNVLDWLTSLLNQIISGVDIVIGWRDSFTQSMSDSSTAAGGFFGILTAGFEWVKTGFDVLLFAASNYELTFPLIGEAAVNAFTILVARVQWFGGVMMDVGGWVVRNWRELFVDVGNYIVTVFQNAFGNIREIAGEAWDWIMSGGADAFEVNLKSLTEGFKATVTEELKVREFVEPVTNNDARKAFGDAFVEYRKMSKDLAQRDEYKITPEDVGGSGGSGGGSGGGASPGDILEGMKIGSADALKATLMASGFGGVKPNEETASNTRKTNELLTKTNTKLDKLARNSKATVKVARRP